MTIRRREQGQGPKLARQVVGWIAAYALVLHAVFAGMVATQLAATGKASSAFELCVTHPDGASAPAQAQHQHDQCALHCASVAGFAALALALIAFVFPLRPAGYAPVRRNPFLTSSFLCRAGQSRAPPLTA